MRSRALLASDKARCGTSTRQGQTSSVKRKLLPAEPGCLKVSKSEVNNHAGYEKGDDDSSGKDNLTAKKVRKISQLDLEFL